MPENTEKNLLDKARVIYLGGGLLLRRHGISLDWRGPIPVLGKDGEQIGWASLEFYHVREVDVDMVDADVDVEIVLCYDSVERLDVETGSRSYYPWIEGIVTLDHEPFEYTGPLFPDNQDIEEVIITAIKLGNFPSFGGQAPLVRVAQEIA